MFCAWYKIWRNKRSAKRYGWKPLWFGSWEYNRELVARIRLFQNMNGLAPTGICDKKTYKLILLKVLKGISKRKH
jgi:murein L,D-transpeptidase YcbB/YkuD